MQRNFDFSASFNAYYLVNPNNLLTHRRATYKYLRVRARVKPRNPYRQRTSAEFPLFHNSCLIMSKDEQLLHVGTHGSCVRSMR